MFQSPGVLCVPLNRSFSPLLLCHLGSIDTGVENYGREDLWEDIVLPEDRESSNFQSYPNPRGIPLQIYLHSKLSILHPTKVPTMHLCTFENVNVNARKIKCVKCKYFWYYRWSRLFLKRFVNVFQTFLNPGVGVLHSVCVLFILHQISIWQLVWSHHPNCTQTFQNTGRVFLLVGFEVEACIIESPFVTVFSHLLFFLCVSVKVIFFPQHCYHRDMWNPKWGWGPALGGTYGCSQYTPVSAGRHKLVTGTPLRDICTVYGDLQSVSLSRSMSMSPIGDRC